MDESDIDRLVEAVLFVADGPVGFEELVRALGVDQAAVARAVDRLVDITAQRGVRVVTSASSAQMVSAPEAGRFVEQFLGADRPGKLSVAALETLAIIAYRQPITRAQVERVRGVNSDGVIRTLLAKSLIRSVGELEQAGKPKLLGTTFEFLQYFGIGSLHELPGLPELEDEVEESPTRATILGTKSSPTTVQG